MGWKKQAAIWNDRLGVPAVISALPGRKVLIVFNYHRIGDPRETPYDGNVFSATREAFDGQIAFLKKHLRFVNLAEAVEIASGGHRIDQPIGLITFDDGYRDNFDLAFPVLRSHGVPGVFFLVTSFVGSARIPWWDQIAYMVKRSASSRIVIDYPKQMIFDRVRERASEVSSQLAALYKRPDLNGDRLLESIAASTQTAVPDVSSERLFLNWDEAREMLRGGMDIASHTHTHRILSKLSEEEQYREAHESRRILEEQLRIRVEAMAYPVGLPSSFSSETAAAIKRAEYRAGFSYYGGVNRAGNIRPFDILRVGIGPTAPERFRLRAALTRLTGKDWFDQTI
jgi:peptidoglycan/xylan/chitin deacetylase (PgdA/CDA1 family)